jgi:hypothetical protein
MDSPVKRFKDLTPDEVREYKAATVRRWRTNPENRAKHREASRRWTAAHPRKPEQQAYSDAKQRCTNPKSAKWKDYGARGIEFRFASYQQFFAELGPRPGPEYSLDRRNNEGHYEPGNVRWATQEEQHENRRPYSKKRGA